MKYPRGRVDFLRGVHGSERDALLAEAIVFQPPEGLPLPAFEIMHPIGLLETRIANVIDLPSYQNEKGLLQARVSCDVARQWLLDELDGDGWWTESDGGEHVGARRQVDRVLQLAESRRGVQSAALYGIDLIGVVPADHPVIPAGVREQRLPRCRAKVAAAIARRGAS